MFKDKKRLYIISAVVIVLLITVTVGAVLVIKSNKKLDNTENKTEDADTSTEQEDSNKSSLPDWESVDSSVALAEIQAAAQVWSADVKFLSCSGVPVAYITEDMTTYLGGKNGATSSWSCFVYSPSLKQDTTVGWNKGETKVSQPHVTWGQSEFEIDPNTRSFFDPSVFISTKAVYDILLDNGLDFEASYVSFNFGLSDGLNTYGSQVIWQINEYSRTKLEDPEDEYSQGKREKIYYVDGTTGEVLQAIVL